MTTNYIDSNELGCTWIKWLLARRTPAFNQYRIDQKLISRIMADEAGEIDPYNGDISHIYGESIYDLPIHIQNYDSKPDGWILETEEHVAWTALINSINRMCQGISHNFTLPELVREDLQSDALYMVIRKLRGDKLRYIPSKAPAFNLLTATIYRCMCTCLSKNKKYIHNQHKLTDAIINGDIPDLTRSITVSNNSVLKCYR